MKTIDYDTATTAEVVLHRVGQQVKRYFDTCEKNCETHKEGRERTVRMGQCGSGVMLEIRCILDEMKIGPEWDEDDDPILWWRPGAIRRLSDTYFLNRHHPDMRNYQQREWEIKVYRYSQWALLDLLDDVPKRFRS